MKRTAVLLCGVLVGCASTRPANIPLTQPAADRVQSVWLHSVVVEDQLTSIATPLDTSVGHASAASSGNLAADIMGHLVAEALIRGTHQSSKQVKDPLLGFTANFDFPGAFRERLEQAAATSSWLRVIGTTMHTTLMSPTERMGVLAASASPSVLFFESGYSFSSDYRQLFVTTAVELWADKKDAEPVYRANYIFRSYPAREEQDSLETVLEHWSGNHGANFRKVLHQGIEENIRLLHLGVFARPFSAAKNEPTTYIVPDDTSALPKVEGHIIGKDKYRMVIKTKDGDYYSIANPDVRKTEFEAHLRETYRAEAIKTKAKQ